MGKDPPSTPPPTTSAVSVSGFDLFLSLASSPSSNGSFFALGVAVLPNSLEGPAHVCVYVSFVFTYVILHIRILVFPLQTTGPCMCVCLRVSSANFNYVYIYTYAYIYMYICIYIDVVFIFVFEIEHRCVFYFQLSMYIDNFVINAFVTQCHCVLIHLLYFVIVYRYTYFALSFCTNSSCHFPLSLYIDVLWIHLRLNIIVPTYIYCTLSFHVDTFIL